MQRFVVVGGGIAGHRAAMELARLVPDAAVDILTEEPSLPYDRRSVSKEALGSEKAAQDFVLSGAQAYAQSGIRHHSSIRAAAIDRPHRTIVTADGATFPYDRLLLATGSRPRRLPAGCVGNAPVHYLRTLQDSLALRRELTDNKHVAVVGGGFIGLEVAAAAISRGCRVTLFEACERVLSRGMPGEVSAWIDRLHRSRGVDIKLSTSIESMRREGTGVLLSGVGWDIPADLVVVGVGIEPNLELAAAAGLEICDGLVVDAQCRTSDPDIFGAGEVTAPPLMYGRARRIESWKSSGEQGAIAARTMAGTQACFDEIPSLWSDQFDANIQAIGFPDLAARYEILGDPASSSWTWVGLDETGTIVGGIAINRGRDASALKRAVRNKAGLSFMMPKAATAES